MPRALKDIALKARFVRATRPPRRRHRHQEIDMHQNLHTQQHEAPLSLWIAAGVAALAYLTALHFATYWTLSGTFAVAAAVSAVLWLRSNR
jgi:hypothetical protein